MCRGALLTHHVTPRFSFRCSVVRVFRFHINLLMASEDIKDRVVRVLRDIEAATDIDEATKARLREKLHAIMDGPVLRGGAKRTGKKKAKKSGSGKKKAKKSGSGKKTAKKSGSGKKAKKSGSGKKTAKKTKSSSKKPKRNPRTGRFVRK